MAVIKKMKRKMYTYKKRPFSLIMFILVNAAAVITIGVLGYIIIHILVNGIPYLSPDMFAWKYTSDNCSMMPAIINTLIMTAISLIIAGPLGIFSAIYLVEYSKKGSKITAVIRLMSETLTGIPSIIYGLFGFLFFVIALDWNYSILAGSCTLAIMVLPVIMRSTEEALLAVPESYREGSYGLGAGKLRTIFRIVLPCAVPGILAGVILATGRIVGETAALIYTSGTVTGMAKDVFSSGRTLSIHMYSLSREGMHTGQGYATAVVLLILVVFINLISALAAKKYTDKE